MERINHNEVSVNQCKKLPRYLYHYTRINCLEDIFNDENGKKVCIRFTDMHFLNDIDEGIYFYKFLEEHKGEIIGRFQNGDEQEYCRKSIDDFLNWDCYKYRLQEQYGKQYSFSLSELEDSMYFWQADYAKENGIALRLDTSKYPSYKGIPWIEQVCYFNVDSLKSLLPDFEEKVRDESKFMKYQDELDDYGDPVISMSGSQDLARHPFWIVKAKTWEPEKEWRMVKSLKALNLSMKKQPDECSLLDDFQGIGETFKVDDRGVPRYYLNMPNPFTEIILGPTFSDYYVASVKGWLKEHKYDGVDVVKSAGRVRFKY